MNNRFRMSFDNLGSMPRSARIENHLASVASRPSVNKNMALNAPMVQRVHNAKPGCSACGKKVA